MMLPFRTRNAKLAASREMIRPTKPPQGVQQTERTGRSDRNYEADTQSAGENGVAATQITAAACAEDAK
jgi:hypothetical protein